MVFIHAIPDKGGEKKLELNHLLFIQVLLDMIRVPEWAFEAAGQEMRGIGQDTAAYHPGLYLTAAQVSPTSPRIRTEFSLHFGVVLAIFVSFCIQVSHFRSIVAIYLIIIIIIILICFGF